MGFLENKAKEQEGPVPGETEHSNLEEERSRTKEGDQSSASVGDKAPDEVSAFDIPASPEELAAYERVEQLEGQVKALEAENNALRIKVGNLNRRLSHTKKVGNR